MSESDSRPVALSKRVTFRRRGKQPVLERQDTIEGVDLQVSAVWGDILHTRSHRNAFKLYIFLSVIIAISVFACAMVIGVYCWPRGGNAPAPVINAISGSSGLKTNVSCTKDRHGPLL